METTKITVTAIVNAPIESAWNTWISPTDIVHWNTASDDWHTTKAHNDLRVGGKFSYRMEAKDGTMGFDFEGIYNNLIPHQHISYTLGDSRKVTIDFSVENNKTKVVETFDAENTHSIELQRHGWQAILNNFKKVAESKLK
jgi:uncharacterized protein YndB with AHSA1/START domain